MSPDPAHEHEATIELTVTLKVAVLSRCHGGWDKQMKHDAAVFNDMVRPLLLSEARKQYTQKLMAARRVRT